MAIEQGLIRFPLSADLRLNNIDADPTEGFFGWEEVQETLDDPSSRQGRFHINTLFRTEPVTDDEVIYLRRHMEYVAESVSRNKKGTNGSDFSVFLSK